MKMIKKTLLISTAALALLFVSCASKAKTAEAETQAPENQTVQEEVEEVQEVEQALPEFAR